MSFLATRFVSVGEKAEPSPNATRMAIYTEEELAEFEAEEQEAEEAEDDIDYDDYDEYYDDEN